MSYPWLLKATQNKLIFFAFKGETPGPFDPDPGNQGGWVSILPWLMLAVFYFLTAGSDPTPETTWSTFYREMLSTGEVTKSLFFPYRSL